MAQLQRVNTIVKATVLLGVALVTFAAIQGSIYFFTSDGQYQGEPLTVEIPQGTSTAGIAGILQEKGIVKNATLFRLYVRYREMDGLLQAGEYQLYENMHPSDILAKLQEGRVYRDQTRFTVPEGLRVEEVAQRLAAAGLGDEETFLALMADPGEFKFSFISEIPEGLEYPLEGYLAPDTYFVYSEASEAEALKVMLQKFNDFYTDEVRQRLAELDLTLHEAVTLASIVERETRAAEERSIVAAVFHNRLERGMLLQSCATVQYALGEVKPVLLYADLEVESPYNTYMHMGLPPGPIASPGRASLEAVLYPADVNYLYFVYRDDGTGRHYFAENLRGHNANIKKAQENRRNN